MACRWPRDTSANGFLATTGGICLGSWTGSQYFTGMVDDFQLYQRGPVR